MSTYVWYGIPTMYIVQAQLLCIFANSSSKHARRRSRARLAVSPVCRYDARFPMPFKGSKSSSNHWWSYDAGPAHVIALNSCVDSTAHCVKEDLEAQGATALL